MNPPPNHASFDFEFQALRFAVNYRRALLKEFRECLRGRIIEVGAGIGQVTEMLAPLPGVESVLAVEPDTGFNAEFRRRLPNFSLVGGTVADVPPETPCDAIVSINVLEHISDDERELAAYAGLLEARRGALCLFVPARPEIYAPLDRNFGHFRRYTRRELRAKLERAGFQISRCHYFNAIGYFAWWFNFCLLKKKHFDEAAVRFFDSVIFPAMHAVESNILRPFLGQSLLAVARARKT